MNYETYQRVQAQIDQETEELKFLLSMAAGEQRDLLEQLIATKYLGSFICGMVQHVRIHPANIARALQDLGNVGEQTCKDKGIWKEQANCNR